MHPQASVLEIEYPGATRSAAEGLSLAFRCPAAFRIDEIRAGSQLISVVFSIWHLSAIPSILRRVVSPGEWRERTKRNGVVLVVQCFWAL